VNLVKTKSFELAVNSSGDKNSKKLALVLPGRLDTKDYECFNTHLNFLSSKGFYAVSFDPPGTWESPGGIELFTTTNYIKATNELIEYFGNKPTLLLGHSRGASVAIMAGTRNAKVVGIVAIMPSLGSPSPPSQEEVKTGIHSSNRDLPPGNSKTQKQKKFELPIGYFKDGAKYDDAEVLKTCTKPKLIFYGVNDKFNSPDDVKKIFDAAPPPKVLYKLNCSHDYRYYPEVVNEVNNVVSKFLETYIRK
jgi:pimeloyl-ACP methyl ester carboxylesterase